MNEWQLEQEILRMKKAFKLADKLIGLFGIVSFFVVFTYGLRSPNASLGLFLIYGIIIILYITFRNNYDKLQDFYVYYKLKELSNENRKKKKRE